MKGRLIIMFKSKLKRIKSVVLSGLFAITAVAPSFTSFTAPLTTNAASSDNYAKLLQYSLFFYDANMCGSKVSETSLLSWRGDCHTSDEVDGGYHDAGDHAMFGLPQGYTASTIGWAYYEFKDAFDATGQTNHYKTVANYFSDFFKNCTVLSGDSVSKFCIQKGVGNTDHSYWGSPEAQGDRGGCDWRSSGCGDIAAEYAAALAVNYINFGDADDLKYAKALYKYAKNNASVSTGDCTGFYKSDSVTDDIAWAAGWLYLATNDSSYASDCASNQAQYLGWVHDWNNVSLGAACLQAHITGDWSKVNSWIGGQTTSNNYWFLLKWGSARYNASMQLCALAATKNSSADYSDWCKNQMDYLLGNNPANTCFVVGYANNSAKNPHHRAASGYSSYDEMGQNTQSSSKAHSLIGALVGGPTDAGGSYVDSIQDYVCNEVAIDYNAGLVGAAAGLYSVYKTGTVDSTIVGAKNNGSGSVVTKPSVTTTTSPRVTEPSVTTTKKPQNPSTGDGKYTITPNKKIVYSQLPEDDKMIGFDWADFDIPAGEKVTKVEVNVSASSTIGKWQGAFGSSTSVSPDYWTQSDEMEQKINGTSGTITWNIDSATSEIIQTLYGGQLKFGIWWVDCGTFTIDSITAYTGSGSSTVTTAKTTSPSSRVTTTKTTTQKPSSGDSGVYVIEPNEKIVYSQLPENDKMIGWEWSEFGIPTGEKVKKVEINISASSTIGKWQGAFGSSTSVSPDYWTQSDEMEQTINGKSGAITWNIDSATSEIIQTLYGGELKFGIWWIDCGTFTIDSIKVYTDGSSSSATTTKKTTTTTKATTTKTTTSRTTTTKVTTTIADPSISVTLSGDVNCDNRVDVSDAVLLKCYLLDSTKYPISAQGKANADVHGNNGLNAQDAVTIQKYVIRLINSLPV